MSWLTDLWKKKDSDPVVSLIVANVAGQKAGELMRKLDDTTLALLLKAAKDETRRRLEE